MSNVECQVRSLDSTRRLSRKQRPRGRNRSRGHRARPGAGARCPLERFLPEDRPRASASRRNGRSHCYTLHRGQRVASRPPACGRREKGPEVPGPEARSRTTPGGTPGRPGRETAAGDQSERERNPKARAAAAGRASRRAIRATGPTSPRPSTPSRIVHALTRRPPRRQSGWLAKEAWHDRLTPASIPRPGAGVKTCVWAFGAFLECGSLLPLLARRKLASALPRASSLKGKAQAGLRTQKPGNAGRQICHNT